MSFNYSYYQHGSQSSQYAQPFPIPSPQTPTIAMLTQNGYSATPFSQAPPPTPVVAPSPIPSPAAPRPREPTPTQASQPSQGVPKRARAKGKGKQRESVESGESAVTATKKKIPSWTRVKVRGKSDEQFMLDICCKPEFWNKWRGGDKMSRKADTIKWINGLRSDFGFPEPRNEKSITAKITQIERNFREAVVWKGRTGQGLKDDDILLGGGSVRDKILSMCPRFYDLWDVLSRRMGTVPQSLWSTGDENDDILELMLDLATRQDGDIDGDGDTDLDTDDEGSQASNIRRRRARNSLAGTGDDGGETGDDRASGTPLRDLLNQPSQASLMGEFPAAGPSQMPLEFPGRRPPPETPTPSGDRSKRPKSIREPREGSNKKDNIIGNFLSSQGDRLEIDRARLELEQARWKEEREREQREREERRAREDRARDDRLADRAAWDAAWERESARGVDLGAFVHAFGSKPL